MNTPAGPLSELKIGLLEFSGPEKDRCLTLRTLDTNGKELWWHEIRAAELQFPPDEKR